MSESYGDREADLGSAGNAFYNSLWEQAAAQGITVAVSSGDGGSAGCDDFNNSQTASHGIAVSGIAGTPFNVSVGGTDFNQTNVWTNYWNTANDSSSGTSAKNYIPEIPWSETCAQLGLTGCGSTTVPASAVKSSQRHSLLFSPTFGNWWTFGFLCGRGPIVVHNCSQAQASGSGLRPVHCLRAVFCSWVRWWRWHDFGRRGHRRWRFRRGQHAAESNLNQFGHLQRAQSVGTVFHHRSHRHTANKPLTGSIVFYVNGNEVGSFGNSNGKTQIGWGYLTAIGMHQITASYTGDSNNMASNSTPLSQIITGTTTVAFVGATGGDTHFVPVTIGVQ